jgi:hypothetical protein
MHAGYILDRIVAACMHTNYIVFRVSSMQRSLFFLALRMLLSRRACMHTTQPGGSRSGYMGSQPEPVGLLTANNISAKREPVCGRVQSVGGVHAAALIYIRSPCSAGACV